jgi:glycosyltransferase involved in cell wall biosynthesis
LACKDFWPIDERAGMPPAGWSGWPGGKKFALVLTHDVDTEKGQDKCRLLMQLEQDLGFRSSFNFVPKRYDVSHELISHIDSEGFEVGVHGLYHDGKYYESREGFRARAAQINKYMKAWGAIGYRAPSMISDLAWFHDLDIKYDSSTFDTDPFEPQAVGVKTIYPFTVNGHSSQGEYVELPYTLPQDFTLFVLQKERTIAIWKRKLDWIAERGGMALLITHPDYMNFNAQKQCYEEYPSEYYKEFLEYVSAKYQGQYWHALPKDVAHFWAGAHLEKELQSEGSLVRSVETAVRKHVCMIVYSKYKNDARVRREAETLAALPGYRVSVLTLKEARLPTTYVMNGVKVYELDIGKYRGKSNIKYMLSYFRFTVLSLLACSRLMMKDSMDIVHVHNMPNFIIFSAIIPRLAGKRIILDIHDIMPETYLSKFKHPSHLALSRILRMEESLSCAFAHKIICTNHSQLAMLLKRGIPASKITISMNVPDPALFNEKILHQERANLRENFKLVYHGTRAKRLGIDVALRAVASLVEKIHGIEFTIIGDGDDRQEFMDLSRELGLQNCVHFRKTIPLEDLASSLQEMSLGIVSNRRDCATELMLPVKMLEYIALGIPVVVPRLKAIEQYFSEDMVFYFEPNNVDSLADSILTAFNDETLRSEKVERAKYFLEKYGWQKHKFSLIELYKDIASGPSLYDHRLITHANDKLCQSGRGDLMRACILAYTFYESDNRVRRYAESLVRQGYKVDAITLRKDGQPRYGSLNGVRICRIQKRRVNEKSKLSYLYRLVKFLVNSAFFLSRQHRHNNYSLIHVHSVPDFEVFATFLAKMTGARIILDIHDLVPEFYASKFNVSKESTMFNILKRIEKASIGFADHVIIANHIWERTLVSRSVREEKCTTILNYPDLSIFYKRPRTRKDDKFVIIYPGTLNWHQGLDIAVKAFSHIKDKVPEAELHIYGEGPSKSSIADLVSELCLQNRVFLKGTVPAEQIAFVMANADLGIVPKRNDSFGGEAFSTKIFEFMALGIPVIVSGTKIDKYYFNNSVVHFFEPEDESDLAKRLLLIMNDKELRERISTNASQFINQYTWDKREREYLSLVDSLLEKKRLSY